MIKNSPFKMKNRKFEIQTVDFAYCNVFTKLN